MNERVSDELLELLRRRNRTFSALSAEDIRAMAAELQQWRKFHQKEKDLPRTVVDDVERIGMGFVAVTAAGMTRLAPEGVSFSTPNFPAAKPPDTQKDGLPPLDWLDWYNVTLAHVRGHGWTVYMYVGTGDIATHASGPTIMEAAENARRIFDQR